MSGWDCWVNCLLGKKRISTAGIFGLNGDKYSANFEHDVNDLKTIISHVSSEQLPTSFSMLGKKFIVISNVNGVLVGKSDKSIAAIGLSNTTCVVGLYIDGADPSISQEPRAPDVMEEVEKLIELLKKSGC